MASKPAVRRPSLFLTFRIFVMFVDKDGEETLIKVPVGMNLLENDIELEGKDFSDVSLV